MKAEQIRVGNLAYVTEYDNDDNITSQEAMPILSIPNGLEADYTFGIDGCPEDGCGVQPIPITGEWMIKLGFEKKPIRDIYFIECGEYRLEVVVNGFSGSIEKEESSWFVSINPGYGNQSVTIVKQYIHELQNLYYELTEKDLEYEL